jgi:hypothetical protein
MMEDQQIVNTIKLLRKWFEAGDGYTCRDSDYIGFEDRGAFNLRELAVFIESNFTRKENT